MHLLGAAVGTRRDWHSIEPAVDGRIWNYWSTNDKILRYLYRLGEAGTKAIGCEGIPTNFEQGEERQRLPAGERTSRPPAGGHPSMSDEGVRRGHVQTDDEASGFTASAEAATRSCSGPPRPSPTPASWPPTSRWPSRRPARQARRRSSDPGARAAPRRWRRRGHCAPAAIAIPIGLSPRTLRREPYATLASNTIGNCERSRVAPAGTSCTSRSMRGIRWVRGVSGVREGSKSGRSRRAWRRWVAIDALGLSEVDRSIVVVSGPPQVATTPARSGGRDRVRSPRRQAGDAERGKRGAQAAELLVGSPQGEGCDGGGEGRQEHWLEATLRAGPGRPGPQQDPRQGSCSASPAVAANGECSVVSGMVCPVVTGCSCVTSCCVKQGRRTETPVA